MKVAPALEIFPTKLEQIFAEKFGLIRRNIFDEILPIRVVKSTQIVYFCRTLLFVQTQLQLFRAQ